MVLWGVGAVQVSKEGQTAAAESVGQERLPSTRAYLVIGDNSNQWTFIICLRHQMSNASIFFDNITVTGILSDMYSNWNHKVTDDYLSALVVNHDIVRFNVAVHDTHTVTIIKRLTHTQHWQTIIHCLHQLCQHILIKLVTYKTGRQLAHSRQHWVEYAKLMEVQWCKVYATSILYTHINIYSIPSAKNTSFFSKSKLNFKSRIKLNPQIDPIPWPSIVDE